MESQLYHPRFDTITERVAAFCARQGLALFDPLPALRARDDKAGLFVDGIHYSEAGHRAIAEILEPVLRARLR